MNSDPASRHPAGGDYKGPPSEMTHGLHCPHGVRCRLRVLDEGQMLVQCMPDNPNHICSSAQLVGGAYFCRDLMKS